MLIQGSVGKVCTSLSLLVCQTDTLKIDMQQTVSNNNTAMSSRAIKPINSFPNTYRRLAFFPVLSKCHCIKRCLYYVAVEKSFLLFWQFDYTHICSGSNSEVLLQLSCLVKLLCCREGKEGAAESYSCVQPCSSQWSQSVGLYCTLICRQGC